MEERLSILETREGMRVEQERARSIQIDRISETIHSMDKKLDLVISNACPKPGMCLALETEIAKIKETTEGLKTISDKIAGGRILMVAMFLMLPTLGGAIVWLLTQWQNHIHTKP